MYTRAINGSWGVQVGATPTPPASPVLALAVQDDDEGITATLSGETAGTTNTLYLMHRAGAWTDEGSTWVSGEMDVDLAETGVYYGYVGSVDAEGAAVSNIVRIVFEGPGDEQADDNIPFVLRAETATAVYWPPEIEFDEYGAPVPQTPFEISCRYEESLKEFIDLNGTTKMSRAQVFVDRDLEMGGILMLGTLDDVDDWDNPKENSGAWEILSFEKTANFRGTHYLRMAYL